MLERHVTVAIEEGLHARPAALFAKLAADQPVSVQIARSGGAPAPAGSILSIMMLGAKAGDAVTLTTDDQAGAQDALDALAAFLEQSAIA
jgi:phosphocarrier protein